MGGVYSAVRSGYFGQCHQLTQVGVGAGLVIEPQAQGSGPGFHPLAGFFFHDLEFRVSSNTGLPAHGVQAHRAMGDLGVDVRGNAVFKNVQIGFGRGPIKGQIHGGVGKVGVVPELPRSLWTERGPAKAVRGEQLGGSRPGAA